MMTEATAEVAKATTTKTIGAKAKPKAKAKAKAKPVAAAKVEVDMIEAVAVEVENLTKTKALRMASSLSEDIEKNHFKLGGVLSLISENDEWFLTKGHENFSEFVEAEYGIKYRKAMYMVQIYRGLVGANVPWAKVKDLGWSKLVYLSNILNPENVDEWVKIAKGMTKMQLEHYVKEQAAGTLPTGEGGQAPSEATKITSMTFKLHEDQKETIREALDKAKAEADTEYDTVALEAICLNYIAGEGGAEPRSMAVQMKEKGWEEVLNVFEEAFPDVFLQASVEEEEDVTAGV